MDVDVTTFVDSGRLFDHIKALFSKAGIVFNRHNIEVMNNQGIQKLLEDYDSVIRDLVRTHKSEVPPFFNDDNHIDLLEIAEANNVGDNINNVVARLVISLRDHRDAKHQPETDFILFMFGLVQTTYPLFRNSVNALKIFTSLRNAMLIRIGIAQKHENDFAHRRWTVNIFSLLCLFKNTDTFATLNLCKPALDLLDELYDGYAWLSLGQVLPKSKTPAPHFS